MVARNRAPSWPSEARWSPARVRPHNWPHAEHAADSPGPFHDLAEADECDLGRVDDAEDLLDALVAEVGDGDGRVGHLGAAQSAGSGPTDKVAQRLHELVERELVGVVDGGGDQAPAAERHGDAEVHGTGWAERALGPEAVHGGDCRGQRGRWP